MGSRDGTLPAHLQGRGSHGGPLSGSYVSFTACAKHTIAGGVTDLQVGAIVLPFGFRIEEIGLSCTSSAGGASRGTIQVTDGTNDLISSDALLVTAGSVRVNATSSPSLVAAQRTRLAGARLRVDATTVASEVITDLVVTITGYTQDHVNADSVND